MNCLLLAATTSGMSWGVIAIWIIVSVVALIFAKSLLGIVYIPADMSGIVTVKFANSKLKDGEIIALNGEPGVQADLLSPGLKLGKWPWKYKIEKVAVTVVPEGTFCQVVALVGKALDPGRNMANFCECNNFQDARKFLAAGQRGQQLAVLPPGNYRINTKVFKIEKETKMDIIEAGHIGVVTVQEGKAISDGEIAKAGPTTEHNFYQNAQAFIDAGGFKGLQIEVLQAGRYAVNPWFAKIEQKEMQDIAVGHCGVVISFVGSRPPAEVHFIELPEVKEPAKEITEEQNNGENVAQTDSKQADEAKLILAVKEKRSINAQLVDEGQKGVLRHPLETGKYPINPYVRNVIPVPITQITLYWAESKISAHELDKELSTLILRSKDAFDIPMIVAVIIHIPLNNAPMIVANYGSVEGLISQVLQPTVSSYFRNSAQNVDALDLYQKRQEIQTSAKQYISQILESHFVECKDVLIDDVKLPIELTKTITDRQIATQQEITYKTQKVTADSLKDLRNSEAMADIQTQVVKADQGVNIAEKEATAIEKRAKGNAEATKTIADGNAHKTKVEGEAEAGVKEKIGLAEAKVIRKKVESMGEGYTLVQIAEKLMSGNKSLVPNVFIGGGGTGDGAGTMQSLITMKLVQDLIEKSKDLKPIALQPEVEEENKNEVVANANTEKPDSNKQQTNNE